MTAVIITKSDPFDNPTSGADYDEFLKGGFRGASSTVTLVESLGDPLWILAGTKPSLDLNFAQNKSLIDQISSQNLITFTRASSGTYVGIDGLIKMAATNEPRFDHNPVTLESLGLLVERQGTQLLQLTDVLATQTKTVAAAVHTLSFYGTGTVVLSGAHSETVVGTGAYPARTTRTFTPTAGALTLTVTGTVQFGQLEAGGFATSYIPNAGTGQVTRSADVANITGGNFSRWYRQDEGTLYGDFNPKSGGGVFGFDDTTSGERIRLGHNGSTSGQFVIVDNNTPQGSLSSPANSFPLNTTGRVAAAYAVNNFAVYANSLAGAPVTSGTLPIATQATIGNARNSNPIDGTIRRIVFWPHRLPDSTLQGVTQ
jgi:hypothetical protein